ncbi:MAG: ATP-binding protein [Candidatus Cloacimonetes bacterium]|nr:ATP-binding protein [Candidatus Cloacimonadota bacterium]
MRRSPSNRKQNNSKASSKVETGKEGTGSSPNDVALAKSAFIANISHEIRTPMNAIMGFAQMLQNTKLNERQADYVDVILDSGKKLLLIISNLLDLSNLQLGKTALNPRNCNVQDVTDKLWQHFEPIIRAKHLDAILECAPDIPVIMLDCEKVERVLSFIISNAIKYTTVGFVAIRVYTKPCADSELMLCMEVADSGIGISADKQEHIFDVFEQADNSVTRPYGGTGIGLGLSQQIVLLLGGTIRVQSTLGTGSRFFIEVPVQLMPEQRT